MCYPNKFSLLLFGSWSLYQENFSIFVSQKNLSAKMACFVSLSWWVLHPSATLASALSHITHHADRRMHEHTYTHKLHSENYITSLPLSENYICPSQFHQSLPRSPFFSLFASLLPCLPILGFSLHFNSALNCQAWIALWTAWGGQAGRGFVWMRESLCYHHLFSFSSPSGAVRSQTRYHSPPAPRQGVTTQHRGNGIKG